MQFSIVDIPLQCPISSTDLVEDGFGDDKFFYTVVAELKNPPTSSTTNGESTRSTDLKKSLHNDFKKMNVYDMLLILSLRSLRINQIH